MPSSERHGNETTLLQAWSWTFILEDYIFGTNKTTVVLRPVVQSVDGTIHRKNYHPRDDSIGFGGSQLANA